MKFIKCDYCGHFNEIKTEYLTLCESCGKKLANNFQQWKRSNPDKSLEDFKAEVGKIKYTDPVVNNKSLRIRFWISLVIVIVFVFFLGTFLLQKMAALTTSLKTTTETLTQKWEKQTYGGIFTVETPSKMTRTELPVPDEVKKLIEELESYVFSTSKGLKISLNYIKYKPEVGTPNLQGAANGSISEMKMQPGVTDFDYTEEAITKDGIPGFIQRGSYNVNDISFLFINTAFVKEMRLYQLVTLCQADDETGKVAAERVITSIKFESADVEM